MMLCFNLLCKCNDINDLLMLCSGWIGFILPLVLVLVAMVMLWRKQFNKGKEPKAVRVKAPPSKNAVEQLLLLQDAVSQFESLIQTVNVGLLKIRAITLAILPQVERYRNMMMLKIKWSLRVT